MNKLCIGKLFALFVLCLGFAACSEKTDFKPLFADDLSNADYDKTVWSINDGILTATSDQAIWTKDQYENFVLDLEFKDNVKAHILQPDGTYVKPDKRGKAQINSQMEFCIEATEKAALHKHEEKKSRVFIPAEPAEDIEE